MIQINYNFRYQLWVSFRLTSHKTMKRFMSKRKPRGFMVLFTPFIVCLVLLWSMVLYYRLKHSHIHPMDTNIRRTYDEKHMDSNMVKTTTNNLDFSHIPVNERRIPVAMNVSVYRKSKLKELQTHTSDSNTNFSDKNVSLPKMVYKFYLTASIMVRIYKQDKNNWTIKELKQWMHYLLYAGVEHIYLCNHYESPEERLEPFLNKYIDRGLLTYIDWPWNASDNKGKIIEHQSNCYYHVIAKHGNDSKWQLSIDMDEYPLCCNDLRKNFLYRYLQRKEKEFQRDFKVISQIIMENYLMMGQGDRSKMMIIERINRITKKKYNRLTKPIFRPLNVLKCWVHWWDLKTGDTIYANTSELRMLHYWGSRTQNWGPDTDETISLTNVFQDVAIHIAPSVRTSLLSFGEFDAFSNKTGP